MSALKRYTKPVDGTIPVPALLYQDEDLLASQDGVGIYDGSQKSPQHQSGSVHVSTLRLFYIDTSHPRSRSFALDLSHVCRTDYWAGLLRSSAKVTLYLNTLPSRSVTAGLANAPDSRQDAGDGFGVWVCEVCGNRNPPGLSPSASVVCGLCGVPRSAVPTVAASSTPTAQPKPRLAGETSHLSSSLPSSSHHLPLPAEPDPPSEIACPACTFLNHPSLSTCEICGTTLPRPAHPTARSAPPSRPTSDDEDDAADAADGPRMIKISFRKGGDKAFYAVVRRSLLDKAWEGPKPRRAPAPSSQEGTRAATPNTLARSGINGILQDVQTAAAATQTTMEDALQDLETLKVQAREMVRYAGELNERLTALSAAPHAAPGGAPVEPEEATFIRASLAQLGLQLPNAPVTLDMLTDERRWHEELARELAGVLQGAPRAAPAAGMMRRRGIVALDEVWGGWNRARGVALIPPATFLLVLPYLPQCTAPPVHARTFASGLAVLHTPPYTRAAFSARLGGLLTLVGPRTTVEVAYEEALPVGLVQEMLLEVEAVGEICRDEGEGKVDVFGGRGHEVHWCMNIFLSYVWDGQD
ncbi:EAP30/Vps36 family-domain-containing protein [Phanerochaete sordida]|uniref:Vacuolar protein-sorting-associated protein 36 n=1 Tax=Phanerochaete sordida TaxID=48140 RepID=A0A9P3LIW1_9APHY|nr:EAP30/Vps36 family-domain-containing protein [Phanerochaete sordida]